MLQQHQSRNALTTPTCWGCCRTRGKERDFLTADITCGQLDMDKSENESMVGTCDSHKMLTLPVAPFVLDRSLDPSFHGSLDTHFTA